MLNKKIVYFFAILWLPLLIFIIFKDSKKEDISDKPEIIENSEHQKKDIILVQTNFKDLPNFNKNDINQTEKGFLDSCSKINFQNSEFLSNSEIKIPTKLYQDLCNKYINSTNYRFSKFVMENFTPFLVTDKNNEFGKFTSYYESRINISYEKTKKYKYPIYGTPKDLISINLQDFDETLPNKVLIGRIKNQKLVKYHTRKDIYNNKDFNAPIILWTDDYVDLFIMQIQGSAIGYFENGNQIRISYANNNGHPFTGIGSILLSKKLLKPGKASMKDIKEWLKDEINKDIAFENMLENERYIFHMISNSEGPLGAMGVPVRAGRSLAVDPKYIPLGSLLWIDTIGPNKEPIQKMVVAQDVGNAIKGVVRGDYFWGSGDDEILDLAGKMNSSGKYYILLPNEMEITNNE